MCEMIKQQVHNNVKINKIGIMQPYFFPYIAYWQLINAVDVFVIYDDVNYIKGGWINRNNILLNGKAHLITLPLDGASPFSPINQTKMIDNKIYKKKLIKTLEQAYKKAPYFNEIAPLIHDTIFYPSDKIIDVIYYSIKRVSGYIGINTKFILSSALQKNDDLKGQDKVLHICELLCAAEYINAIGGFKLYDKKAFANVGMKLHLLKTKEIIYNQWEDGKFVHMLSIIDVLMFNDVKTVQCYLKDFTLV